MAFGTLVKDGQNVPIAQGYVPGDTFRAAQSSLLKNTDGATNVSTGMVTSDAIREATLNGQSYRATFYQTIGGAAQGWYSMSVFNPSTSGKLIILTSMRGWINGATSLIYVFKNTTDPALANTFTPINRKMGSAASALTTSVTYNSASPGISFPGTTNIDTFMAPSSGTGEVLHDDDIEVLPAGSAFGVQLVLFVGNSQQYGFTMKWSEF